MTTTGSPALSSIPPSWQHCGHGADAASDPVGCRGRQVEPHGACLAHLTDTDRSTYLTGLAPGSDLDHRGTHLTGDLLEQVLHRLHDPTTGRPCLGTARFDEATFSADAWFEKVTFSASASFRGATFEADAWFERAMFEADAWFERATFSADAVFSEATFSEGAWFRGATFEADAYFGEAMFSASAWFRGATFEADAWFERATFSEGAFFRGATFGTDAVFSKATFSEGAWFGGTRFSEGAWFERATFEADAWFGGTRFSAKASFAEATFEAASHLGPVVCNGTLSLSGARFASPVTIEAAAARLICRGTRWDSRAALRLRYAAVDLSDAVYEYPLSITTQTTPFRNEDGDVLAEGALSNATAGVSMTSLRGADASHLTLHNVDLASCIMSGTLHLDQLRLEGECPLAPAPSGLRRRGLIPVRWTARRTLAEEQYWRAAQGRSGWREAPEGVEVVGPAVLAPVYRRLRKLFEDGKNEPDAADFYYGEMDMRRHDPKRPRAERALLALYWAVSGYGLRSSRALGWLLGAMSATVLVMMLWGIPTDDPKPATTGRLTGQKISLTTDKPDPLDPTGPLSSRLTSERWEKSLRVVVNSVVFRSSGQDLTIAGTYTEMASRLTEPVLLGLAALAIRGRVKR
ncbi:pentapeptide repeat-containing protein (plasmid) [Streptomyces sp. NBC_00390]|uniref:pentapeptide repeat-containing protein n=1 Tax=Streptomyces sp. NBC_00390 TaxID=2975736 RepID=UPI002E21782F